MKSKNHFYANWRVPACALLLLMAVSCQDNLQEPVAVEPANQGAKKGVDFTLNLDLCASLVAQTLDDTPNAPEEIYKAIRLGYEGDSKIPLSFFLDGAPAKAKAGKFKNKAVAIAPTFKQALKRKNPAGNLLSFITLNQIELYWPYWQEWDGKELPTISFTPANSTKEGVGYQLVRSGNKYKLERVAVNDDYAFAHPTWILQEHIPVDAKDLVSGRFLPNYIIPGDKPEPVFYSGGRKGVGTPGGVRANDEQLPDDGSGGGGDYDPGYYYGSGPTNPGPELVEVPTNSTAAVNQILIYQVRTNGRNFRDIFGGGDNVMYFHRGDSDLQSQTYTKTIDIHIDRWAGRKGVWRTANALWDANWHVSEVEQLLALETVNSGVESDDPAESYSGQVGQLISADGSTYYNSDFRNPEPGETRDCMAMYGDFNACNQVRVGRPWFMSKPKVNQVPRRGTMNRRFFFASNTGDAESKGVQEGFAVRNGGSTRNSGVYFTMKAKSFDYR